MIVNAKCFCLLGQEGAPANWDQEPAGRQSRPGKTPPNAQPESPCPWSMANSGLIKAIFQEWIVTVWLMGSSQRQWFSSKGVNLDGNLICLRLGGKSNVQAWCICRRSWVPSHTTQPSLLDYHQDLKRWLGSKTGCWGYEQDYSYRELYLGRNPVTQDAWTCRLRVREKCSGIQGLIQ